MNAHQGLDIFQIMLEASIVVKLDLLLLVMASVVSWGIIFKKTTFFKELNEANVDFMNLFNNSSSLKEIHDHSKTMAMSPYRRLFEAGYEEFIKMREAKGGDLMKLKQHFSEFGMVSLERSLNASMVRVEEDMGDSLTTLASIGSITPFVGLFGTVWGIIDSFAALSQGGATIETVAPGIAEALVATAIGLVAAIPAVWFYNKFNSRKAKMRESLVSFGEHFINEVERIIAKKTNE
jgi:biopolymer transport protein TolQ